MNLITRQALRISTAVYPFMVFQDDSLHIIAYHRILYDGIAGRGVTFHQIKFGSLHFLVGFESEPRFSTSLHDLQKEVVSVPESISFSTNSFNEIVGTFQLS